MLPRMNAINLTPTRLRIALVVREQTLVAHRRPESSPSNQSSIFGLSSSNIERTGGGSLRARRASGAAFLQQLTYWDQFRE